MVTANVSISQHIHNNLLRWSNKQIQVNASCFYFFIYFFKRMNETLEVWLQFDRINCVHGCKQTKQNKKFYVILHLFFSFEYFEICIFFFLSQFWSSELLCYFIFSVNIILSLMQLSWQMLEGKCMSMIFFFVHKWLL